MSISALYKLRNADDAPSIGSKLTPSYLIVNGSLRYRIYKTIGAYLQVNNIANRDYTDVLGAQMPGRWIMAGLSATF